MGGGDLQPLESDGHTCYVKQYTRKGGYHCGGESLTTLVDAPYGEMTDLQNCKLTCNSHPDCKGFVLRESDGICGHWKGGDLQPLESDGLTCYEKQAEATTTTTTMTTTTTTTTTTTRTTRTT